MSVIREKEEQELRLNLSPMIDVVFLILIYFIVSMQLEPSLDNILKLPPIFHASEQEDALLQIYVLPAKIEEGGSISADSTGLIAFSDKAKTPDTCPYCRLPFKDEANLYVPNRLLDQDMKPIPDLKKEMADAYGEGSRPPAFHCSRCGNEISPYLKLKRIPEVLQEKKKEVLTMVVRRKNFERQKAGAPPLTEEEIEAVEKEIPLMIKADRKAFYGRILQVVNMAKMPPSEIRKFAFVTLPEASEAVIAKQKGK